MALMKRACVLAASFCLLVACSDESSATRDVDSGVGFGDASVFDAHVAIDSQLADASGDDAANPIDASLADASDLVDAGADAAEMPLVSDIDFESDVPAYVALDTCMATPSQGYEPLGHPGNVFGPTFIRCLTGATLTVTLDDLPAHDSLSIDFLFAAIDSLDGTGDFPAGDYFRVDLDGVNVFRESFANATLSQIQSYEPPSSDVVLARREDLGFSGPGSFYTDSAYDMSLDPRFDDLAHSASTAVITFTLEGLGVQSLDDESWAIDNLRVSVR